MTSLGTPLGSETLYREDVKGRSGRASCMDGDYELSGEVGKGNLS